MKNFHVIVTISVLLLFLILGIFINNLGKLNITAKFEEMEPFYKNLDVYYKGFKLGRTVKIYPSNDYKDTNVDIKLRVEKNILPENISVKLKSKGGKDYIDIIYPEIPSEKFLISNAHIKGSKNVNIASYIDGVAEDGSLNEITDNLNSVLKTAGVTLDALTDLFVNLDSLINEVKPNLVKTSSNLAMSSENIAKVTSDFNNAISNTRVKNTFSDIESTAKNLKSATKKLENASESFSILANHSRTETISLIDCGIKNLNKVFSNINNVVIGISATLEKRFSGLRILFGKALN